MTEAFVVGNALVNREGILLSKIGMFFVFIVSISVHSPSLRSGEPSVDQDLMLILIQSNLLYRCCGSVWIHLALYGQAIRGVRVVPRKHRIRETL